MIKPIKISEMENRGYGFRIHPDYPFCGDETPDDHDLYLWTMENNVSLYHAFADDKLNELFMNNQETKALVEFVPEIPDGCIPLVIFNGDDGPICIYAKKNTFWILEHHIEGGFSCKTDVLAYFQTYPTVLELCDFMKHEQMSRIVELHKTKNIYEYVLRERAFNN